MNAVFLIFAVILAAVAITEVVVYRKSDTFIVKHEAKEGILLSTIASVLMVLVAIYVD